MNVTQGDIYINSRTAEIINAVSLKTDSKNFDKVWFRSLLSLLEKSTPELKLLVWIVANRDKSNNHFIGMQREISEKANISLSVVNRTLRDFQKVGFIKKIQTGVYMINPLIIISGDDKKQRFLTLEFLNGK